MTEHYTARRCRDRNALIIRAYRQSGTTRDLPAIFDLSLRQIQRIIANNLGDI